MRALTSGSGRPTARTFPWLHVPLEGGFNSNALRALPGIGAMLVMMRFAPMKLLGCIKRAHRALLERDAIASMRTRGTMLIDGQGFARSADDAARSSSLRKILAGALTKIVAAPLLFGFIPLHRILDCLSARRAAGVREQPA